MRLPIAAGWGLVLAWLGAMACDGSGAGERPAGAPPMYYADATRKGVPFSKDPSVVRFGGRYLMYFSLPPFAKDRVPEGGPRGWGIGIAESGDLTRWEKVAEINGVQPCETNGICAPGARVIGGRVHLFYQTYGNGPRDAICHAVSGDGIRFERDPSNPVFRPSGSWNSGRAIDAEVFESGDRLIMLYATRDPTMSTQMVGAASAPMGSDFGRAAWRQEGDGPVLSPELEWEMPGGKACIEAPSVCRRAGRHVMFYAGGYNNGPQQVGVAESADGLRWRRLSDRPLLPNGEAGSWNASESGHPGIFEDSDGRTWLFFQGNNDGGKTWYLSCVEVVWREGRPVVLGGRP
ncbi:MAG: family 43 glycosylhydrolase [Verrucomicrobiae bacterium]|nr:family 43 glycosylhydrolase [Verrucomicrobiae bacterium]